MILLTFVSMLTLDAGAMDISGAVAKAYPEDQDQRGLSDSEWEGVFSDVGALFLGVALDWRTEFTVVAHSEGKLARRIALDSILYGPEGKELGITFGKHRLGVREGVHSRWALEGVSADLEEDSGLVRQVRIRAEELGENEHFKKRAQTWANVAKKKSFLGNSLGLYFLVSLSSRVVGNMFDRESVVFPLPSIAADLTKDAGSHLSDRFYGSPIDSAE